MNHHRWFCRCAWVPMTLLLLGAACQKEWVELDPNYRREPLQCSNVSCAELPRCSDGGTSCQACHCCACTEGNAVCDPYAWNKRWVCHDGCFVEEACPMGAGCLEGSDQNASCNATEFDCAHVHPYDMVLVCGQTEALCAACGSCLTCSEMGGQSTCDFRPSGNPQTLLSCLSESGCITASPCADNQECLYGMSTGLAQCGDASTCATVGCTGYPICDVAPEQCGTCGCCPIDIAPPDACGRTPDNASDARYILDTERGCFDAYPCDAGSICTYDTYDRPVCVGR